MFDWYVDLFTALDMLLIRFLLFLSLLAKLFLDTSLLSSFCFLLLALFLLLCSSLLIGNFLSELCFLRLLSFELGSERGQFVGSRVIRFSSWGLSLGGC